MPKQKPNRCLRYCPECARVRPGTIRGNLLAQDPPDPGAFRLRVPSLPAGSKRGSRWWEGTGRIWFARKRRSGRRSRGSHGGMRQNTVWRNMSRRFSWQIWTGNPGGGRGVPTCPDGRDPLPLCPGRTAEYCTLPGRLFGVLQGTGREPVYGRMEDAEILNGYRYHPYEICLMGMFLGVTVPQLVNRTLPERTQEQEFDETVRRLREQGLQYPEIAKRLNAPYDTVKSIGEGRYKKRQKNTQEKRRAGSRDTMGNDRPGDAARSEGGNPEAVGQWGNTSEKGNGTCGENTFGASQQTDFCVPSIMQEGD